MRTLIVDDDYLAVQALEMIMNAQPDIEVVATGYDGAQAVDLYRKFVPDLVLMDIRMETMSGLEAATRILAEFPNALILFITTFQDDEYIAKAIALGCKGYILKQNIKGIVPAIEAIQNGHLVFDSNIVHSLHASSEQKTFPNLTEREQELLMLVAEGLNNKEIAKHMYLSEGTVRNYLSALLEKLELRDRTQLAVYYYKH